MKVIFWLLSSLRRLSDMRFTPCIVRVSIDCFCRQTLTLVDKKLGILLKISGFAVMIFAGVICARIRQNLVRLTNSKTNVNETVFICLIGKQ